MTTIITLREFARRVGVSLTAVQKGAREDVGRIQVIRDPKTGKITGIDWETQEAAWYDNCKTPQRRPHNPSGGRPRLDGQPTATPVERRSDPPKPEAESDGGMSMTAIQRARELVKLQIDNENLKKVKGENIPRAEVFAEGAKLASTLVSALYNIPDRISDELAGMKDANEIDALLRREFDAVVSEIRGKYGR